MATDEVKRAHTDRMIAETIRNRQQREQGYREQALKIYPWICGRCAREFTRENVHQLTVHHRDHNHDNNPKDGSNWELLCIYCHDNEHARELDAEAARRAGAAEGGPAGARATSQPFADLKELLARRGR
jgi:5-methylcytosine-specific restriction endonuclease McrA